MSKGYVYIMTIAVDGIIKIGRSKDWTARCQKDLESNGYKNMNGLKTYFVAEVDDQEEIESIMHDIFTECRVADTEMFAVDKDRAKRVLSKMGIQIYPKIEENKETKEPKEIKDNDYMISKSSDKYTFKDLGIPVGATLVFKGNKSKFVKVLNSTNQVIYDGRQMHISRAAWYCFNQNDKCKYNGFGDFKYNDVILKDLKGN